jgi:hypothetical protein
MVPTIDVDLRPGRQWVANRLAKTRRSIARLPRAIVNVVDGVALAAQVIQRLVDAVDRDDFHAVDSLFRLVCARDDGAMEA